MFFIFLSFFHSNVPDNKCHKQKWRVIFSARIKLVARVLACARAIVRIKWRGLTLVFSFVNFAQYSSPNFLVKFNSGVHRNFKYIESIVLQRLLF